MAALRWEQIGMGDWRVGGLEGAKRNCRTGNLTVSARPVSVKRGCLKSMVLTRTVENQEFPVPKGSLIFNVFPLGIKGQKTLKIQMKDF
jgi:hypothetical protein